MARKKQLEKLVEDNPLASPEARAERLKRVRNMANLPRQQMCDLAQVNINTYKGWEIARYGGLTRQGAIKVLQCVSAHGVQCSFDWLMYGIGIGPKADADSSVNQILSHDDETDTTAPQDEEQQIINELLLFRQHHKHAADLIVKDDSMLPQYTAGDYVAGVKRFTKQLHTLVGMNCIVQTKEGQILLRYLRAGTLPDTYTLVSLNIQSSLPSLIMENVRLASAAPVIWHRRKNP